MILLLEIIFFTSLLVMGYTVATQEEMVLHPIRKWATGLHEDGNKWIEGLLLCHWCQPSTWTLLGFLFAVGMGMIDHFEWRFVFMYPLAVCGSSLVNGFTWSWYLTKNAEKEYYQSAQMAAEMIADDIAGVYDPEINTTT